MARVVLVILVTVAVVQSAVLPEPDEMRALARHSREALDFLEERDVRNAMTRAALQGRCTVSLNVPLSDRVRDNILALGYMVCEDEEGVAAIAWCSEIEFINDALYRGWTCAVDDMAHIDNH